MHDLDRPLSSSRAGPSVSECECGCGCGHQSSPAAGAAQGLIRPSLLPLGRSSSASASSHRPTPPTPVLPLPTFAGVQAVPAHPRRVPGPQSKSPLPLLDVHQAILVFCRISPPVSPPERILFAHSPPCSYFRRFLPLPPPLPQAFPPPDAQSHVPSLTLPTDLLTLPTLVLSPAVCFPILGPAYLPPQHICSIPLGSLCLTHADVVTPLPACLRLCSPCIAGPSSSADQLQQLRLRSPRTHPIPRSS